MLHPTDNRINFGDTLRPIDGYSLDYAIGTSYTLELEAIMFLPISLFFGEDLEIEKYCSNELLTALTQIPKKVQLFCQRGKVTAPFYYHNILEFWSENIEQIQMDAYDQSFHPKIWLLRYTPAKNNLPVKYRFICTSRNLSKSTDWDLAITLEGEVGKTIIPENSPLEQFVRFLDSKATKKVNKNLLNEISKIKFELDEGQEMLNFFPISKNQAHPLFDDGNKVKETLVISPFLDISTIKNLQQKTDRLIVLSTKYELDKLPNTVVDHCDELYQFNPLLELEAAVADEQIGLTDISDSNVEAEQEFVQGNALHAKLFITKKGHSISWYIGSANCTQAASLGRNIEFLTAVSATKKYLTAPEEVLTLLTETNKGQQGIFIPYVKEQQIIDEAQELLEKELRKIIYDISALKIVATVSENENRLYDYHIKIAKSDIQKRATWKIYLQPLSGLKGISKQINVESNDQDLLFGDYELHRLTPFFLISIKESNLLIKTFIIKLEIAFPEDKMKRVLTSLIGDWDKLMKYLSYLLSREQVENIVALTEDYNNEPVNGIVRRNEGWKSQFPIYEKLLVAASRDRQALKQTVDLVEMLQDEKDLNDQPLIAPSFKELITTFKEIMPDEY